MKIVASGSFEELKVKVHYGLNYRVFLGLHLINLNLL
jgi:hypothetical protein